MWVFKPKIKIPGPASLRSVFIPLLIFSVTLVIVLQQKGKIDKAKENIRALLKEVVKHELGVPQISPVKTRLWTMVAAGTAERQNTASHKESGMDWVSSGQAIEYDVTTKVVEIKSKGKEAEGRSNPMVMTQVVEIKSKGKEGEGQSITMVNTREIASKGSKKQNESKLVRSKSKGKEAKSRSNPMLASQVIATNGGKEENEVDVTGLKTEKDDYTRKKNDTVKQRDPVKGSAVQMTPTNPFTSPKHVNPHDFAYLINNESLCSQTEPLHHLIYFHSSPASATLRNALRNSWAQNGLFSKYPSRVVFFMGRPQDDKMMKDIKSEATVFGDIVMEDYHDSYTNMTYKAIGALKWIMKFCHKAKYAIKADQDVYVNRLRTVQLLTEAEHVNKTRFFMCTVHVSFPILRDPKTCMKWCVPKDVFPNRTYYPQYCAGGMFTFTTDIAKELYKASLSTPYFYIDDVYLTGILAKKVGKINYIDFGPESLALDDASEIKQVLNRENATDYIMGIHDPFHKDPGYYWRDQLRRLSPNQVALLDKDKYQSLLQQTSTLQSTGKE